MSSTLWTYNQIIQRLEVFANGHYFLQAFTHGQLDVKDLEKFPEYPRMHVAPEGFDYSQGSKVFNLRVLIFDKPRQVEEKPEYQREVISDCQQVIEDLVYELKNGRTLFGKEVDTPDNFSVEAFMESFENVVTGCEALVSITVPNNWSACNIPANWALSGSGSTTSPAYGGLVLKTDGVVNTVQNILDLVEGTNITITDLGDGRVRIAATGGGGGGLTCGDLAACQTIIDLDRAISTVAAALTAEAAARAAADTALNTAVNGKEPTIAAGTTAQYWRGDKSWQTLNAAAIGDATTVGQNLVKLTNPSAVRYLQVNTDNTVTALSALQLREAMGIRWAVKSGDQAITTVQPSTANVSDLSISLEANARYHIRVCLRTGCSGTGGIRVGFSYGGTATALIGFTGTTSSATTQAQAMAVYTLGNLLGTAFNSFVNSGGMVELDLMITTTTAGTLQLIGATQTSPQTSTIYAQSDMKVERTDA